MEKKVLSPHNGKKQNYALKSFLWGMAVIAAFIIPCIIMDKGMFLYFGDYNVEVLPFYELMSEAIKTGEHHLLGGVGAAFRSPTPEFVCPHHQ